MMVLALAPEEAHSMMSEFMESGTWHFTTEQQEEMDEGEFYLIQSLFVNDAENDTTLISQVGLGRFRGRNVQHQLIGLRWHH